MKRTRRGGGPRGVAATLPRMMKAMFRSRGFAETGVLIDWPDIVGRPLADFTSPEKLTRDGTLQVRVSGGWALEVTHLEPALLDRIASYYGYRAVTRLALMQGPLPAPAKPRQHRLRALSSGEEAVLDTCLDDTGEPKLRAALERLGRAVIAGADGAQDDQGDTPGTGRETARNGA